MTTSPQNLVAREKPTQRKKITITITKSLVISRRDLKISRKRGLAKHKGDIQSTHRTALIWQAKIRWIITKKKRILWTHEGLFQGTTGLMLNLGAKKTTIWWMKMRSTKERTRRETSQYKDSLATPTELTLMTFRSQWASPKLLKNYWNKRWKKEKQAVEFKYWATNPHHSKMPPRRNNFWRERAAQAFLLEEESRRSSINTMLTISRKSLTTSFQLSLQNSQYPIQNQP